MHIGNADRNFIFVDDGNLTLVFSNEVSHATPLLGWWKKHDPDFYSEKELSKANKNILEKVFGISEFKVVTDKPAFHIIK